VAKVFMLGGFQQNEKVLLQQQIEQLGGEVCDVALSLSDWQRCTHVVIKQMRRTEKLICGLSKGMWVLTADFVAKSVEQGLFVSEEAFEWYSAETLIRNDEPLVWMGAMRQWREAERLPFAGFRFVIINSADLQPPASLLRIMGTLGGGEVLVLDGDQDAVKLGSLDMDASTRLIVVAKDTDDFPRQLLEERQEAFDVVAPMVMRDYLLLQPDGGKDNLLSRLRDNCVGRRAAKRLVPGLTD